MDLIRINGKAFPGTLVGYKGKLIDVNGDGAGETENGVTILDVRRRNKGKVMLKFDSLTLEEFSEIMEMINASTFEVRYFCGFYIDITAYAGDKDWELIHASSRSDSRWKLEFSIIEI